MALTSSIYRMARPEATWTADERERRLKGILRRLLAIHGETHVVERIRAWPADEGLKASVVLLTYTVAKRHAGSF